MSVISLEEWRKKLDASSDSTFQSKLSSEWEKIGQTPIDEIDANKAATIAIAMVVDVSRMNPFTTKSGFARMAANEVAIAASEVFISTRLANQSFTNKWMVTKDGLDFLESVMDEITTRH